MPLAEKLLEVPIDLVRAALDLETSEGSVIADSVGETRSVFLAGLHRAERNIAERLVQLANGKLPWAWIDPDKALTWVEDRIGLVLAESQVAATENASRREVAASAPRASRDGEVARRQETGTVRGLK